MTIDSKTAELAMIVIRGFIEKANLDGFSYGEQTAVLSALRSVEERLEVCEAFEAVYTHAKECPVCKKAVDSGKTEIECQGPYWLGGARTDEAAMRVRDRLARQFPGFCFKVGKSTGKVEYWRYYVSVDKYPTEDLYKYVHDCWDDEACNGVACGAP